MRLNLQRKTKGNKINIYVCMYIYALKVNSATLQRTNESHSDGKA